MNTQQVIRLTIIFIVYILVQVLFLRKFILFDYAFCFLYVGAILRFPQDFNSSLMLIISFLAGLLVDMFYNTPGLHAAACVALAFVRTPIAKAMFSVKGLETELDFSLNGMGMSRFARYVILMVSIHHILLFSIEAASKQLFWITALKIFFSIIFSSFVIVVVQYLRRD